MLENNEIEKFEKEFAEDRAAFFNCLTKEQQLLVFCEVINKLTKAELVDRASYRGILYNEFGFDTDSYAKAQLSGFIDLHNSIESKPVDLADFAVSVLDMYGIAESKEGFMKRVEAKKREEKEEEQNEKKPSP